MRRRFYCDYCDKSFIDDVKARKRHLESNQHIKLKNIYYESCRDPETILKEELLKTPCKRFLYNHNCPFEGICKQTHYSPEQLCELRQQVEYIQTMRRKKKEEIPKISTLESWLEKYNETPNKEDGDVHIFWTYPEALENRPDLPPSLLKFRFEHFTDDNFEEWGK